MKWNCSFSHKKFSLAGFYNYWKGEREKEEARERVSKNENGVRRKKKKTKLEIKDWNYEKMIYLRRRRKRVKFLHKLYLAKIKVSKHSTAVSVLFEQKISQQTTNNTES